MICLLILNILVHVVCSASSDLCVMDVIPTANPQKNMQKKRCWNHFFKGHQQIFDIFITLSHTMSVIPKQQKILTGDTVTKALLPKIIPNLELTSGKPPSTWWRVAARLPEMLQRRIQLPNCRKSRLLRLEWTEDVSFLWEKVCFRWGCM